MLILQNDLERQQINELRQRFFQEHGEDFYNIDVTSHAYTSLDEGESHHSSIYFGEYLLKL